MPRKRKNRHRENSADASHNHRASLQNHRSMMTLTQTQLKKWPKIKWNLIHFTADQPNQSVINFAQNISKEIKSSNEQRSLSEREHTPKQ